MLWTVTAVAVRSGTLWGSMCQWWSYQVTVGVLQTTRLSQVAKIQFSRGSVRLSTALSDLLNIYRDSMCWRKMSDTADTAESLEPLDVLLCGFAAVIISPASARVHGRLITSYTDLVCHEHASWGCCCMWVVLELPEPHLQAFLSCPVQSCLFYSCTFTQDPLSSFWKHSSYLSYIWKSMLVLSVSSMCF